MSLIKEKGRKKKRKYPRNRISRKINNRNKLRRRIYQRRGWKLSYPAEFEEIDHFPYIRKKSKN